MKPYSHLPGYLHRWSLISYKRLSIRLHKILDIDRTPFLHSHPFHYVSIVVKGGYDEKVLLPNGSLKSIKRRVGSICFRRPETLHRIDSIQNSCTTLFFTWKLSGPKQNWVIKTHQEVKAPRGYMEYQDGLYEVPGGFRRRSDSIWFKLCSDKSEALITD